MQDYRALYNNLTYVLYYIRKKFVISIKTSTPNKKIYATKFILKKYVISLNF